MNPYLQKILISLVTFWALFSINLLHADDIESLKGDDNGTSNILFIMDLSGSMGWKMNNTTRLDVMQQSLAAIIEQAKPNMRIGIMTFGPGENHYVQGVQFPVSDITTLASDLLGDSIHSDNLAISPTENETTQQFLARMTTQWKAGGGTPIVDALYEAALYFRGETIDWGNGTLKSKRAAHPLTYNTNSKKYISPITNQCQANYAVLLSDGSPTYNLIANSPLARTIKAAGCTQTTVTNGQCAAEITQFMANSDNNSVIPGDQSVKTFTIGLGDMDNKLQDYMRSLVTTEDDPATPEREGYFIAKNKEQLVEAFNNIFEDINKKTPTFSSPNYSLSTDNNGMSHDGNVYVPFVVTSPTAAWFGNLKKFKIKAVENNIRTFMGKNNQPAFNDSGDIADGALDYWSTSHEPDGSENLKGGVSSVLSQMNPEKRTLYTNIVQGELNQSANYISDKNTQLSSHLLNASDSERTTLLKYIRGLKASSTSHNSWIDNDKGMGDILHFKPQGITYGDNKKYIIVGTNEGFLHAFDENTGNEVFAFMPKELLPNIKKRYENKAISEDNPHIYGVDGLSTLWHSDFNKNGKIDKDLNEKAYLYFGLRRGGTGYYALDITDINKPALLWSYNTDGANKTLGQSWSKPYLARVFDKNDTLKPVIVITGGYDTAHDNVDNITTALSGSKGNNIVILDAETGNVLWTLQTHLKEGMEQIKHSIPGGARLIDMNRNGALDRLYFGDTGGNLWRLDINESLDQSQNFTAPTQLTQLASLNGNGSENRQFYNEPELSILRHKATTSLALSIGSGQRPHPKNEEIDDHLFVLLDRNVNNLPQKTSTNTKAPDIKIPITNTVIDTTQASDKSVNDIDKDDRKNCMIYNSDEQYNLVVSPYQGRAYANDKIENLLVCDEALTSNTLNLAGHSKLANTWNMTGNKKTEEPTGKNCRDILVADYMKVQSYNYERKEHYYILSKTTTKAWLTNFNESNSKKVKSVNMLTTTMGSVTKKRICESYDSEPDRISQKSTSSANKAAEKRWETLKKSCEKEPQTHHCSEAMSYNEALSILFNQNSDEDDQSNTAESSTNNDTTQTSNNNSDTNNSADNADNNTQNSNNIITLDQLAAIKANDSTSELQIDYGKLADTNLIDSNMSGWHFELPASGEKSLANAMTNEGTIFFTSYLPKVSKIVDSTTGCMGSGSSGRLYAFDLLTAKPSIDLNQDNRVDEKDIYMNIASQAIPETPQRFYNELNCTSEGCNYTVDIRINTMSKQATSYDQAGLQAIYWIAP